MIFYFANFHISFAVVLLSAIVLRAQGLGYDSAYFVFIYFSSLFIYNIDRYYNVSKEDRINCPGRSAFHLRNRKVVLATLLVALLAMLGTSWALKGGTFLILIACVIVTFLYLLVIQLRDSTFLSWLIAVLKIVLLAGVWTVVVGIAPIVQSGAAVELRSLHLTPLLTLFLIFVVNAMWFDLRDRDGDALSGKGNLANLISDRLYFIIMIACSLLALIHSVIFGFRSLAFISVLYLLIGLPWALRGSYGGRGERFYYHIIDLPLIVFPLIELLHAPLLVFFTLH
jgi:hypothetical protein